MKTKLFILFIFTAIILTISISAFYGGGAVYKREADDFSDWQMACGEWRSNDTRSFLISPSINGMASKVLSFTVVNPSASSGIDGLLGTTGGSYGVPLGEDFYIELGETFGNRNVFDATTLELEYLVIPGEGDIPLSIDGDRRFVVYLETGDGWTKAAVTAAANVLTGEGADVTVGAKRYNDNSALVYRITTNDLAALLDENEDAYNIRIYPFGKGSAYRGSCLRIKSITLTQHPNGTYEAPAAAETQLVPFNVAQVRALAAQTMRGMANVQWTPQSTLTTDAMGTMQLTYEAGVTYRGLPYVQKNYNNTLATFTSQLQGGVYTGDTTYGKFPGTLCSSSVDAALSQYFPVNIGLTETILPEMEKNGLYLLGGLNYLKGKSVTQSAVLDLNTENDVYEAYALLEVGDILVNRLASNAGHARLVTGTTYVSRSGGVINPSASYVVVTENAGLIENGSSWRVDKQYTFANLYANDYVPLSLESYKTGFVEAPEIELSGAPEYATFSDTGLLGVISSNYKLEEVKAEIYDVNSVLLLSVTKAVHTNAYGLYYGFADTTGTNVINNYLQSHRSDCLRVVVTAKAGPAAQSGVLNETVLLNMYTKNIPPQPQDLRWEDGMTAAWDKAPDGISHSVSLYNAAGNVLVKTYAVSSSENKASLADDLQTGLSYYFTVSAVDNTSQQSSAAVSSETLYVTAGMKAPAGCSEAYAQRATADRALWKTNSNSVWCRNATVDGESGHYLWAAYNNTKIKSYTSGGITYDYEGLPVGETMSFIVSGLSIAADDYTALELDLTYANYPGDSDINPMSVGKARLYVSTDGGVTYKQSYVDANFYVNTERTLITTESATVTKKMDLYRMVSDNLLKLVSQGETITNLLLKPYGDSEEHRGAFRVYEAVVNGYTGNAAGEWRAAKVLPKLFIEESEMRALASAQIKKVASVSWTPSAEIETYNATFPRDASKTSYSRQYYRPGVLYYGPSYCRPIKSTYELWTSVISNGVYTGGTTNSEAYGMDCSGIIYDSVARIAPIYSPSPIHYLIGNNWYLLGGLEMLASDAEAPAGGEQYDEVTKNIKARYVDSGKTQQIYYGYSLANIGDVVFRKGHVRMVTVAAHTEYTAVTGGAFRLVDSKYEYVGEGFGTHNINPDASYLHSTETAGTIKYTVHGIGGASDATRYYLFEFSTCKGFNQDGSGGTVSKTYRLTTEAGVNVMTNIAEANLYTLYPNLIIDSGSSIRIDRKYTFTNLINGMSDTTYNNLNDPYLVTSMYDYSDQTVEHRNISFTAPQGIRSIAVSGLTGTVDSNYRLYEIDIDICDEYGSVIRQFSYIPITFSFNITNKAPEITEYTRGLAAGSYMLRIKTMTGPYIKSELCEAVIYNEGFSVLATPEITSWNGRCARWNAVSGAVSYTLSLYKSDGTLIDSAETSEQSYGFYSYIAEAGAGYYVKISAEAADGVSREATSETVVPGTDQSRLKVTVTGGGASTLSYQIEGGDATNGGTMFDIYPEIGSVATVTLTITDAENFELLHFRNAVSGRVLEASGNTLIYTITDEPTFIDAVVIAKVGVTQHYVTFLDFNNKVIKAGSVNDGDDAIPPTLSSVFFGFSFECWDRSFTNVTNNLIVRALYKKAETSYTVYVKHGDVVAETLSGKKFDDRIDVAVTAEDIPSGMSFAGWSFDREKAVSYSMSYTFYVSGNMTVTALFSPTPVMAVPKITTQRVNEDNSKVSFMSIRSVPAGYSFIETGMLFTKNKTVATDEDFTFASVTDPLAPNPVKRLKSDSTARDGQFILNVSSSEGKIYARSYLIYKNISTGSIVTVYGEISWGVIGGSETSGSALDQTSGNI